MGNDVAKEHKWKGPIEIEIVDNHSAFVAGEVVKGFVHVYQKQSFPAKNLTIGLFG